jgi:hypothetical protein
MALKSHCRLPDLLNLKRASSDFLLDRGSNPVVITKQSNLSRYSRRKLVVQNAKYAFSATC